VRQCFRQGRLAVPRRAYEEHTIPRFELVSAQEIGSLLFLYQFPARTLDGFRQDQGFKRAIGFNLKQEPAMSAVVRSRDLLNARTRCAQVFDESFGQLMVLFSSFLRGQCLYGGT
jgi:hypothetical protein